MREGPGTNTMPSNSVAPTSTSGQSDNQLSTPVDNLPIALRRPTRTRNTPGYLKDYKHDIANHISYKYCSPSLQSFIASLDLVSIPKTGK